MLDTTKQDGFMRKIQTVCVFCGAAARAAPEFYDLARATGALVAASGWTLVYGGSKSGTMGAVADGALASGARVIGAIPRHLEEREQMHPGLTECHVVDTMHQRKQKMVELSDAFIVLPGGFGTMDEVFEGITWRQIGLHDKPFVIVNHQGFWQPLIDLIDQMGRHGFIRPEDKDLFVVVDRLDQIPAALARVPDIQFDPQTKWM